MILQTCGRVSGKFLMMSMGSRSQKGYITDSDRGVSSRSWAHVCDRQLRLNTNGCRHVAELRNIDVSQHPSVFPNA